MVRTPTLRVSISWTEMSLPVELVGFLVSKWRWQSPRKSGIYRFLDRTEGQKSELFYQNMKNVGPWRWFSRCRVGHTSVRTWVQILRLHRRPEPVVHARDPSASTTKWETTQNHEITGQLAWCMCIAINSKRPCLKYRLWKGTPEVVLQTQMLKMHIYIHCTYTYTQRWKY